MSNNIYLYLLYFLVISKKKETALPTQIFFVTLHRKQNDDEMRKIFSCFIFITMCIMAHAQMHSYSTNFTYSQKHFVDTIPIEVVDNQIFVTGTVNGRPYRFCIDTGSGQGTIYDNAPFEGMRSLLASASATGRQANASASWVLFLTTHI